MCIQPLFALLLLPAKDVRLTLSMETSRFSKVISSILAWECEKKEGEREQEKEKDRELDHKSNVINDSPICTRWTINHSQVNVTDRRLGFPAANRMNFDNINGIPLFSCTHSFCSFSALATGCFGYQTITKICSPIYWGSKRRREQSRRRERRA